MDTISSLMPGMAMSRPPMSMPSMMAMPSAPPPKPLDLSFVPRSPAIPGLPGSIPPPLKPASMFHKPKPNVIPANVKAHMKKPSHYKPTHPSTVQLPATVTPAKQTIQPASSSSSLMLPAIGGALLVLFFIMKR